MPELIATLGSNPLPVVVSALHHQPSRLHLVVTPQVEPLASRVWAVLGSRGVAPGERLVVPDSAAADINQLLAALATAPIPWANADLDYTGGTKLMAAEIRGWWRAKNPGGTSSYLSQEGRFVYGRPVGGAGPACSQASARLSFAELAELHFEHGLTPGDAHRAEPQGLAADRILEYVSAHDFEAWRSLLPPFRPQHLEHEGLTYWGANAIDRNDNLGDDSPLVKHELQSALHHAGLDGCSLDDAAKALGITSGTKKDKRKAALKWLEGEWLELAFARRLEALGVFDEVHQDVKRVGNAASGDNFQADLVAVKGYRAYLFSCTTMSRAADCKHKLFEAAHRTARVGGDYARAALVSLMPHPHQVVQNVREDGWEGYDQYRSFGLPHLRGEAAASAIQRDGSEASKHTLTEALKDWIET